MIFLTTIPSTFVYNVEAELVTIPIIAKQIINVLMYSIL